MPARGERAKYVGAKDEAVVNADGNVPVDAQAIADLAQELGHRPRSTTKSNVAALPPLASLTCITRSRLKIGSLALAASPGK